MKTAIVTGASGNLGQAVCKKFLGEGFHVIAAIVPNDPVPLNINNTNFKKQEVDMMNSDAVKQFVETVTKSQERIDVAVLTVGGFAMGTIAETEIPDIMKQFRLNFETAYNAARPVFLQMLRQKTGRIFLVGSKPGSDMKQSKGMIAYGLAKSLIFRLAELLNAEAGGHDVVTCVIVPSTIDTPQNRQSMPDADFSKWVKPEAIADIIHFYCTEEAGVIREPVIRVGS